MDLLRKLNLIAIEFEQVGCHLGFYGMEAETVVGNWEDGWWMI